MSEFDVANAMYGPNRADAGGYQLALIIFIIVAHQIALVVVIDFLHAKLIAFLVIDLVRGCGKG